MGGTCPWGNVHAWSLCVLPFCVNSFNCGWLKVRSSWSEPCRVHPHGCAAACISPQSNDYMCATKTHLPPPPSHQHLLGCVVAAFSPAILIPPHLPRSVHGLPCSSPVVRTARVRHVPGRLPLFIVLISSQRFISFRKSSWMHWMPISCRPMRAGAVRTAGVGAAGRLWKFSK